MNFSKLLAATMIAGAGPEPGARRLPPSAGAARATRSLGPVRESMREPSPDHVSARRRRLPPTRKAAR